MNEIHDLSRVDAYARSRRRVAFLGAMWKPMLAGGVGAAIMAATVMGSVWAILPKISTREIVVDHVVQRDKPFENYVPHDKPFDNYIPVAVQRDAEPPRADHAPAAGGPYEPSGQAPVAPTPSGPSSSSSQPAAAGPTPAAPAASSPSSTPKNPAEQKFTEKPEFKTAPLSGRIVKSVDGRALSFEDGRNFFPARLDDVTRKVMDDPDAIVDSEPFVGDLGFCRPQSGNSELWDCYASHNGQQIEIPNKPISPPKPLVQKSAAADAKPSPMGSPAVAFDMVNVQVDLGGGMSVQAMLDTGCSQPMSMPGFLADKLVAKNLATRRPQSKARVAYADGSKHELDAISIKRVVVNGRALEDVLASVVPSSQAPVLLGLGALNRLGPFSIDNGKLVFTAAARAG